MSAYQSAAVVGESVQASEPKVVLSVRPCPHARRSRGLGGVGLRSDNDEQSAVVLAPHSSTPFIGRTFRLSWNPREAKT